MYAYHDLRLSLQRCLIKIPFVAILWPDMNSKMCVVIYMYLNISQMIVIPNIYGVGSSIFNKIPFLAFLDLYRERKRCGQVEPSPCYFQIQVVYAFQVLDL